jgi:putative nucleotidyltransferase with HDIG domain
MITREEALDLVKKNVARKTFLNHMLAVEAIMRSLASHLKEDENLWGLTGLLHDLDYDRTRDSPEKHATVASEMLKDVVSEDVVRAIRAHNFQHTKLMPETGMEKALIASDAISGLLVACALVMPTKKLRDVSVKTVAKKFKDKDFARGADRERILMCEEIGIPREKFFQIALEGLKKVAADLGL